MCLSQIEVGLIFFPSKNTSTDYMKIKKKKSGMDLVELNQIETNWDNGDTIIQLDRMKYNSLALMVKNIIIRLS